MSRQEGMLCAHVSRISKQPGPSTHTEVSEQADQNGQEWTRLSRKLGRERQVKQPSKGQQVLSYSDLGIPTPGLPNRGPQTDLSRPQET